MAGGINAIGNLLGKVDANGALLVALDGGTASATQFLAGDGTDAAPAYSYTSNPDTGFYHVAGFQVLSNDGNVTHVWGSGEYRMGSTTTLGWSSSANPTAAAADVVVSRLGAGALGSNSSIGRVGVNGQALTHLNSLTELTVIAAAATTDTTIQMPAGAVVLAVSVRVTVVIPTAATFTVGDSGSAARFNNAAVTVAAGSTDPGTKAGAYYNASALSIRITPNLTPANNSGRVRVQIWYYTSTPPTS